MKKNILSFTIFGFISGNLSLLCFALSPESNKPYEMIMGYAPGLIFGVTISILLFIFYRRNLLFHFIFILISAGAYEMALRVFSFYFDTTNGNQSLFMAGLAGILILVCALRFFYNLSIKSMIIVVIVGSLSGVPNPDVFRIFPIWQTAVAVAIWYAVNESERVGHNKLVT